MSLSELQDKTAILEKYRFLFTMSEGSPENFDAELLNEYDKILKP